MRLDAFEQYIRGITEPDQAERLRHLKQAVKLSPDFGPAWMALGREDYNGQQYEQAADAFAKVDRNGTDGLEAGFYRGFRCCFQAIMPRRSRPLRGGADFAAGRGGEQRRRCREPAGSRRHALFVQAAADDPNSADYHFNLAVSLKRHGQTAAALNELAQCLKLRPNDSEAQALQAAWKQPAAPSCRAGATPARRRDADAELPIRWSGLCAPSMRRPFARPRRCWTRWMPRGWRRCRRWSGRRSSQRRPRAFWIGAAAGGRAALSVGRGGRRKLRRSPRRTGGGARAHRRCRCRAQGSACGAGTGPSADAYLVLGRLDFDANQMNEAANEVAEALKLEPTSPAAQELAAEGAGEGGAGEVELQTRWGECASPIRAGACLSIDGLASSEERAMLNAHAVWSLHLRLAWSRRRSGGDGRPRVCGSWPSSRLRWWTSLCSTTPFSR